MEFVARLIEGTPIWVWGLLILILYIGFGATKDRKRLPYVFYFLPFLVLFSLVRIALLPDPTLAWVGFLSGYILGTIGFYVLQSRWIVGREGNEILFSGEWLTLSVLMIIFFANNVAGTVAAISPTTFANPAFIGIFALVVGGGSGCFLGRALRIIRFLRDTDNSVPNDPRNFKSTKGH
ncbi:MAG: hypothetical protein KDA67_04630 [Rhodobacteraceae bacterium]|nr:hypothetical protein [Paracoccaceae bacterium]